ncbi:hypothetical protein CSC40_3353 [Klebsiella pneumoniae]|nr:hypothetical protein CSC40_3353 [Klebsiella pneumoniae]
MGFCIDFILALFNRIDLDCATFQGVFELAYIRTQVAIS